MEILVHIQNVHTGIIYDVSNIVEPVTITKSLGGEAGKLTCILQKDPNDLLQIANGSKITFQVQENGKWHREFFGWIFTIGTDADGNYKITAYDQMRYLKNSDICTYGNMTASDIFADICKNYNLKYDIKVPTNYVPNAYNFDNKTLYSIIQRGMDLASVNDKKKYYIIDDYGTLVWTEISNEGLAYTINLDEFSGITSFTYEKSIDSDSFDRIKLYKDGGESSSSPAWLSQDQEHIQKWGILQFLKRVDNDMSMSQIREYAENYLTQKNRETETLKLQGEGIIECIAGKRIRFKIPREKIDKYMWIYSSSHTYSKYGHTMDLEVAV